METAPVQSQIGRRCQTKDGKPLCVAHTAWLSNAQCPMDEMTSAIDGNKIVNTYQAYVKAGEMGLLTEDTGNPDIVGMACGIDSQLLIERSGLSFPQIVERGTMVVYSSEEV